MGVREGGTMRISPGTGKGTASKTLFISTIICLLFGMFPIPVVRHGGFTITRPVRVLAGTCGWASVLYGHPQPIGACSRVSFHVYFERGCALRQHPVLDWTNSGIHSFKI